MGEIKQLDCLDNRHEEQKHRPLLDRHIIIPQGGVEGGFKATKIAIHSIQRHGETSGKDIVRCWYEAWYDTLGRMVFGKEED